MDMLDAANIRYEALDRQVVEIMQQREDFMTVCDAVYLFFKREGVMVTATDIVNDLMVRVRSWDGWKYDIPIPSNVMRSYPRGW